MSDPIAQALSKWVFHPAQLHNQPVAVKVLIGNFAVVLGEKLLPGGSIESPGY